MNEPRKSHESSPEESGVRRSVREPGQRPMPAPAGLRAKRFTLDGEEFAVLVAPAIEPKEALPAMTEAEDAVATLVLRGFSNEEIGSSRKVSTRTVANQLQSIYRKLGVSSRVELAQALARSGR